MSKLCQNWQKWQWPIWCISSRWREKGQTLFAFQKYLLLCTFQDKDLLPFKAKQIFVENQGILTDDQHVARRIGTNEWQLVTHCQVLIPKKMTEVSPDEYIRHPSLAVGGSPEQFWEDPASSPPPLLLSPQRLRPHCSPWTAGEPFGEVLGHWPLTIFFFGVTIILGNISLHCNHMCIFKNAKVLTLSSTQLGSQGNLEKIPFG